MNQIVPLGMHAIAMAKFGGIETLELHSMPVPEPGPSQILVKVHTAGVGAWDMFEREGMFARLYGSRPKFPYILGSEGAGTVVAVGQKVTNHLVGDKIYGLVTARVPKDGFYAQFTAVDADMAWPVPGNLSLEEAGVLASNGGTALRGLRDVLGIKPGQNLLVFGAGGGMGHLAVQLAKAMGVQVIAVASGADGVSLVRGMAIETVANGRDADLATQLAGLAPRGFDAALVTGGGDAASNVLLQMRKGGRVAVPNGVYPQPQVPSGTELTFYNANYDDELMAALNGLVERNGIRVHIGHKFELARAADAHRALDTHYLGRIALEVRQDLR